MPGSGCWQEGMCLDSPEAWALVCSGSGGAESASSWALPAWLWAGRLWSARGVLLGVSKASLRHGWQAAPAGQAKCQARVPGWRCCPARWPGSTRRVGESQHMAHQRLAQGPQAPQGGGPPGRVGGSLCGTWLSSALSLLPSLTPSSQPQDLPHRLGPTPVGGLRGSPGMAVLAPPRLLGLDFPLDVGGRTQPRPLREGIDDGRP